MPLTRCFVAPPLQEHTQSLLPSRAALHVVRVLRLRPGATLTLFDGRGGEFEAQVVSVQRQEVRVAVGSHRAIEREAAVRISLLQSLARGERMDLVVQKATELGVAAIIPVASQHSVVQLADAAAARRREHWLQIAISACEQCGRNRIPELHPVTELPQACAQSAPGSRWILTPEADFSLVSAIERVMAAKTALPGCTPSSTARAAEACAEIALLIGPEGGWAPHELELARRASFQPCHLGRRILRAETAPLAALAIVQALLGDLR